MTQQEIQKRSQEKVNQVLSLMKTLRIETVIKKRITNDGFIEELIFWTDTEQYPVDPTPVQEKAEVQPVSVEEATYEVAPEEEPVNENQDEKSVE